MRFNELAQVALDFQGRAIAAWLYNDKELYQVPTGDPDADPWAMRAGGMAPNPDPGGGANAWSAHSGLWMRRLDGARNEHGELEEFVLVQDGVGFLPVLWRNGRVGDIGPAFAVYTDNDRAQMAVYERVTGLTSVVPLPANLRGDLRVCHGHYVVCVAEGPEGKRVHVYDAIKADWVPVQSHPGADTALLTVRGADLWVIYQTDTLGFIAHPIQDKRTGVRLADPGSPVYDPDILSDGDAVGWSKDQGQENPSGFARLSTLLGAEFEDAPAVPVTVPVLGAYPRKVWVVPFFSHSLRPGMGATDDPIGHATTLVGQERDGGALLKEEVQTFGRLGIPLVVAAEPGQSPVWNVNLTVAWYAHGSDLGALETKVRHALALAEKPIVAYLDRRGWPNQRPDWVTDAVWPSVMAYRMPGESVSAWQAAVQADLDRVHGYGRFCWLTVRMDDFNGRMSVAETLETLAVIDAWVRQYPVVGLHLFSDQRGNGMAKVPVLRAWAKAFTAAAGTRPSRWDYWQPTGTDPKAVLKAKLSQDVPVYALSPDERRLLLSLL